MAYFKYVQDQLVQSWERRTFEIEASSQEEADEIAKRIVKEDYQVFEDDMEGVTFMENETLYDTEVFLTPEENDNQATMEIYRGSDLVNPVATNAD